MAFKKDVCNANEENTYIIKTLGCFNIVNLYLI